MNERGIARDVDDQMLRVWVRTVAICRRRVRLDQHVQRTKLLPED